MGRKTHLNEKWLTDTELAKILGVSVQKLRNDRYYGRGLPYYKFNRNIRYRESDVLEYIDGARVIPAN